MHIAGEVERFKGDTGIRALTMRHIHKAEEGEPQPLAGFGLPHELPCQRAFLQIEHAGKIRKSDRAEIKRFAVQNDTRLQPVRRGDHEMHMIDDALIGAADLFDVIDAVRIRPAQTVHAAALVKAAADADTFVAEREHGLADAGIGRVESVFDDPPRIDRKIHIRNLCHCVLPFRFQISP